VVFSLSTDCILKYYLDEFRFQRVKALSLNKVQVLKQPVPDTTIPRITDEYLTLSRQLLNHYVTYLLNNFRPHILFVVRNSKTSSHLCYRHMQYDETSVLGIHFNIEAQRNSFLN
jgi:hypothetical protein